jgi:hypothetical protein
MDDLKFMHSAKNAAGSLTLLSRLLFESDGNRNPDLPAFDSYRQNCSAELAQAIASYLPQDFGELWGLAGSHHVIMRALPRLHAALISQGNDRADWVEHAIDKEQTRIDQALSFLSTICRALEQAGDVVVMKSLDHWPDLGGDLDLYTNAKSSDVVAVMRQRFNARTQGRSWGDRLANKWNFVVPGLSELVEIHVGRLGQTGEQVAITNSVVSRSRTEQFGSHFLRVPAPEDRMVISTLQRMYRHFYLRLCDIADNARLIDSGSLDYEYLKSLAASAGLWDGLASYLLIVSEHVNSFRGAGLPLPSLVTEGARFGNDRVGFRRRFLRIPIFPQAAKLYLSEWERLFRNGELQNAFRLSLLPGLAAAAVLEFKLTGSDKGIW